MFFAVGNPFVEVADDFRGESRLGRHLRYLAAAIDRQHNMAFIRLAGNDGRSRVAAELPTASGIEAQATLGLSRLDRVAVVAMLDQYGTYRGFKKLDLGGLVLGCPRSTRAEHKPNEDASWEYFYRTDFSLLALGG